MADTNSLCSTCYSYHFALFPVSNCGLSTIDFSEARLLLVSNILFIEKTVFAFVDISLIGCGLLLMSTCYLYYMNFRNKKLYRLARKEEQQLIEDFEITIKELEQAKEDVFQHNLFLKKLSVVLSHDLQSPLKFLNAGIAEMYESVLNKEYNDVEVQCLELKNSCIQTFYFLNDFALWLRSVNKDYVPQSKVVNLLNLLNEINIFFEELLKKRGNTLLLNINANIEVLSDRPILKVILHNIIDNANKHNEHTRIAVDFMISDDGYGRLVIKDNGKGMFKEDLEYIKSLISENTSLIGQDGCNSDRQGYKLIAHFSKLLNVELDIDSNSGNGTDVIIRKLKINK